MWMIILSALAAPVHEFGHWLVYEMYDVRTHYTFLSVVPLELHNTKLLGEAGGPFIKCCISSHRLSPFCEKQEYESIWAGTIINKYL